MDGSVKRFHLAPFPSTPSSDETPAEDSIDAILSGVDSILSLDDLLGYGGKTPTTTPINASDSPFDGNGDVLERSFCLNDSIGISDVSFNASRSLLAVSFVSPTIFLLSAERIDSDSWSSPPFLVLEGHNAAVTCFAVDSQCNLVSGSKDQLLLRHELASFTRTRSTNLQRAIHAVCCVNEWSFIASSDYAILAVSSSHSQASLTGHCGQVTSLALARTDGILVSGSLDVQIRFFFDIQGSVMLHSVPQSDFKTESPCHVSRMHEGMVTSVDAACFDGVSLVISGGSDHSVILYRLEKASLQCQWRVREAHQSVVTGVMLGVGMGIGMAYSVGRDGVLMVWNGENGEIVGTLRHHQAKIVGLCQSPDGRFVATAAADRSLFVYDMSKRMKCVERIETEEEPSALSFMNGSIVCGFVSGNVKLWSVSSLFQ